MRRAALCSLIALLVACGGCATQRTLRINSEPQGARLFVNGVDRGRTPATIPYTHPGRVDLRLEHPGYESLSREIETPTTIDTLPVIDLVLEPTTRARRVERSLRMVPLPSRPGPPEVRAIHDRARAFRERAEREAGEPGTPGRIER